MNLIINSINFRVSLKRSESALPDEGVMLLKGVLVLGRNSEIRYMGINQLITFVLCL